MYVLVCVFEVVVGVCIFVMDAESVFLVCLKRVFVVMQHPLFVVSKNWVDLFKSIFIDR